MGLAADRLKAPIPRARAPCRRDGESSPPRLGFGLDHTSFEIAWMTRLVMILKFVTSIVFYHTRPYDFTILRLSYLHAGDTLVRGGRDSPIKKKFIYNSALATDAVSSAQDQHPPRRGISSLPRALILFGEKNITRLP